MIRAYLWYSVPGAQEGKPWCVQREGDEPQCYAEVRWSGGTSTTLFRREGYVELHNGPRGIVQLDVETLELIQQKGD